ncbi:MAG TPA: helix-turn-helix transcriptional regulator [Nocardioidaceae bacterium]|nr:helix-turn-helix transcriptional regulator [Nocardioidaceae bacterium]
MTISLRPQRPTDPSTPLLREILGEILRRKRTEGGRTLREVADTARVSLAYISEVERGQKEASSEILGAVCQALGITILELVSEAAGELSPQRAASVTDLGSRPVSAPRTNATAMALAA